MTVLRFRQFGICVAAAAVSSVLTAKTASAYYGNFNALDCVPDNPSSIAIVNNGQVEAKATTNLYCPIDFDIDTFDSANWQTTATVHGWANRYAAVWQACITYSSGGGGECGATIGAVDTVYDLKVPIGDPWTYPGGLYLQGNLTGPDPSGSSNTFFSYNVEGVAQ
jgi:hypothetical protein